MRFRFPEDPFEVTFALTRRNLLHDVLEAPGADNYHRELLVQPDLLDPPIYLNPHLAGQTFYSKVSVSIDNWAVPEGDNLNDQLWQYQTVNRIFCNNATRREKYGSDYPWISNTGERLTRAGQAAVVAVAPVAAIPVGVVGGNVAAAAVVGVAPVAARPAVAAYRHPNLVKCQEPITYDARRDCAESTVRMGFDSQFPFGRQNNALRTICKLKNGNSFLPPGITVNITLQQRTPLTICVERTDLTDDLYYQVVVPAAAIAAVPAYHVRIKKITLWYESLIFDSPLELDKMNAKRLEYPMDIPRMRLQELNGGVSEHNVPIALPRGARFIYIMFIHESQKLPNVVPNSYMSSRFRFPPGLDSIQLSLVGKEGLLFKKGLNGLGSYNGRDSHSLKAYHAELCRKGLYSRAFETFCPPPRNGIGYDSVLALDLTPYHKSMHELSTMRMDLLYTAPAKNNWSVRAFAIVQRLYTFDQKNKWEIVDIV